MKFPSLRHSLMALAMAAGMSAGSASAVTITREFTANWFDPSHSGHGFGIEVIDAPVGKTLVAYWFPENPSARRGEPLSEPSLSIQAATHVRVFPHLSR